MENPVTLETRGALAGSSDADAGAAAMVAGTLCLMSCYVQHPVAIYADRVAGNLQRIAHHDGLSPELRAICRRLADRWDVIRHDAHARASAGEHTLDERPLH